MNKIIILIPAYNEAGRIADVIGRIKGVVPVGDVLVVDDGSRDATAAHAEAAGATVVSHSFNMGYGVAIQTGYKFAAAHGYDVLVQIDGDGQHDPAFIPQLLSAVLAGEADFVVGSRFLGVESYEPSLGRRIGMAFFRKVVSCITGTRITDSTSGYQAFNKKVIRFFTTEVFPCDYPDADILIALHRAGFKIRELAVKMSANSEGKSMHSGLMPFYYVFKMSLSIVVTLLRKQTVLER